MDDWMLLQAQMHQGQSHFATTQTRPEEPCDAQSDAFHAQQQQQPLVRVLREQDSAL